MYQNSKPWINQQNGYAVENNFTGYQSPLYRDNIPVNRMSYYDPNRNTGGGAPINDPRFQNIPRPMNAQNYGPPPLPAFDLGNNYRFSFMPQMDGGYGYGPRPMMPTYGAQPYSSPFQRAMYGYGSNMADPSLSNNFYLLAEESSREAFASIDSIVSTSQSITQMLESTFSALRSSFFAVINMANHVTTMKSHFGRLLSSLTIIQTLKWMYRKLLYLLGLGSQNGDFENEWESIQRESNSKKYTSWFVLLFFSLSYIAPFIIWKLSRLLFVDYMPSWGKGPPGIPIIATHRLDTGNPQTLSFEQGAKLWLSPHASPNASWAMASNGQKMGLIPKNYFLLESNRQPLFNYNVSQPNPNNSYRSNQLPMQRQPQQRMQMPQGVPPRQNIYGANNQNSTTMRPGNINHSGYPPSNNQIQTSTIRPTDPYNRNDPLVNPYSNRKPENMQTSEPNNTHLISKDDQLTQTRQYPNDNPHTRNVTNNSNQNEQIPTNEVQYHPNTINTTSTPDYSDSTKKEIDDLVAEIDKAVASNSIPDLESCKPSREQNDFGTETNLSNGADKIDNKYQYENEEFKDIKRNLESKSDSQSDDFTDDSFSSDS